MTPFYIGKVEGENAWLLGEEAQHCIKVMRLKVGDRAVGIDGMGQMLVGVIVGVQREIVQLRVVEVHPEWGEQGQRMILLISPLHKPDRLEWLVEKAVELGVTEIIPYIGKHTVKTGLRADRLERIMVAALKQCLRSRLPLLHEQAPLKQVIAALPNGLRLIAHGPSGHPIAELIQPNDLPGTTIMLIGPEGDFAEEELELARAAGFLPVSLGQNRLRSETAAIHLLGILKNLFAY